MIDIHNKRAEFSHSEHYTTPFYQQAAELTRTCGSNSLAFFGLALPNAHFLTPDGDGLVNYQRTGNTAIVLGDPVCPAERQQEVLQNFLAFCTRRHWRVAFYQASCKHHASYRALKLRTFKIGEEAIINPQTFTLSGSAMANVRTSCRRAEREGVTITWYVGVPAVEVMQQLEHVSDIWLAQKAGPDAAETGFSTGRLDDVPALAERADAFANIITPTALTGTHASSTPSTPSSASNSLPTPYNSIPRFVTGVATTNSGQACAFVTFTPIYGPGDIQKDETRGDTSSSATQWGWGLDLMRRVPDAPPGVMELLLVRAIERFRCHGASVVSMGLVAMADTQQETTSTQQQLTRLVTRQLGLLRTRGTLFSFKQKFHPHWESRYLVTNTTLALPFIMMAVLRLRNYSGGSVQKLLTRFKPYTGQTDNTGDARDIEGIGNTNEGKRIESVQSEKSKEISARRAWHNMFWQFLRYCLVGGANTLIDLFLLNILLWLFPTHNALTLVLYNSIAYASGGVTSFFLNKYWTFGKTRNVTRREVSRFFITLCIEILYSNGLLWLAGKLLQPFIANITLWGNASKLISVGIGTVISYLFMRFWTFASSSERSEH